MILNQAQAEAVYSAMCALNNVGGRIHVSLDGAQVSEYHDGTIFVSSGTDAEAHPSQTAFATAYGLQQG